MLKSKLTSKLSDELQLRRPPCRRHYFAVLQAIAEAKAKSAYLVVISLRSAPTEKARRWEKYAKRAKSAARRWKWER